MDIEQQIEAVEEMNKELIKNFEFIKGEDEKFLKNVIKQDYRVETNDIIEFMDSLYEISQDYYQVIQNIKNTLSKK